MVKSVSTVERPKERPKASGAREKAIGEPSNGHDPSADLDRTAEADAGVRADAGRAADIHD